MRTELSGRFGRADYTFIMVSLKGHFDGKAIVLDEPASLAVGQQVRVIVESPVRSSDPVMGDEMSEEELAEWLEVETHALRGVPYPPPGDHR